MNKITLKVLNQYIEYLIGVNHSLTRDTILKTIDFKKEFKEKTGKLFTYSFSPNAVWDFLLSNESTKLALDVRNISNIEELDFSLSNYLMDLE
jgi:hypothetical protein